jgi:uncharacterized protein DUF1580
MEPDLSNETLLSLTAATKLKWLPTRRRGARPHLSTFLRWILVGVRGVKLKASRVGNTWCTTEAAIRTFFAESASGTPRPPSPPSPPASRRASIKRAEAVLDKARVR